MNQPIEKYLELDCFFTNSSYNCPQLNLFGLSSEKKLHTAMRRELKKTKNAWMRYNPVGNHKSPFGI